MAISTRRKVTLYVDEDVLRAARVRAARTDRRDSDIVEDALRSYLGFDVVERVWAQSDLGEDEAMRLAVEETRAVRDDRAATAGRRATRRP
jgi:predicted CoA-binding protein